MKIIKIFISIALIGYLIFNIDFAKVSGSLSNVNILLLAISFFLRMLQFPICALRWKKALEIHELNYSFPFLHHVLCVGFFFNNFLPTSFGGDAYRVFKTLPKNGYKSGAVSSILFERISGLVVLFVFGFLGGLITLIEGDYLISKYYVGCFILLFFVFVVFCIVVKCGHAVFFLEKLKKIKKLESIVRNINYINNNRKKSLEVVYISIVFQIISIIVTSILFKSIGSEWIFAKCALIGSISVFVAMLPISINGIGILEGSFVFSAIQLGVDYDQAVVVAFTSRLLVISLSVICGIIYSLEGKVKLFEIKNDIQ